MKIVVTGASGYLGCVIVRQLLHKNHEVIAVSRDVNQAISLQGLPIQKIPADVRDYHQMCNTFAQADIVIHCAGKVYHEDELNPEVNQINVEGTRSTAEAALACNVKKFIHLSSIHSYQQEPYNVPINEKSLRVDTKYRVQYDVSKYLGEQALQEVIAKGLNAVILNPCGVIGPYDFLISSRLTQTLLLFFQQKLPCIINAGFNWVDVRDVAQTTLAALDKGRCGENYILGGSWQSMVDLQNMAATLNGAKAFKRAIPFWLIWKIYPLIKLLCPLLDIKMKITRDALLAAKSNHVIDDRKARYELGHRSRPTLDSVEDLFYWLQENGNLMRTIHTPKEKMLWQ